MPPLFIPNAASGSSAEQLAQAAPDSVDFSILGYADAGQGVISGCLVTAQSSPNATVQSSAGQVSVGNAGYAVPAYASLTIAANASGNPRFDLIIYRVGSGVMVLQGTAGVAPFTAFTTPTWTTDVVLAAIYVANGFSTITTTEIVNKGAIAQPSPMGSTPTLGAKLVVFGHSLVAGYGITPSTHNWVGQLAGLMRSRVWNQAVDGAVLANVYASTATGYGGIPQILQGFVAPNQPVNWRGVYSATPYYAMDDGVTFAPAAISCTTNGTTALTSSGLFGAAYVAGQLLSGTNITPDTYVVSVNSTSSITMSQVASGSGTQSLTFTGWYRAAAGSHAQTPAGVGTAYWTLIPAGAPSYAKGTYCAQPVLPIVMYGNNDIGNVYRKSPTSFIAALEAALARLSAAVIWEDNNPMVTLAGGTWTQSTMASLTAAFGSGNTITLVPTTTGATITVQTPPDFPGGYVDFGFVLGYSGSTLCAGALNFTVDGANTNVTNYGTTASSLVNFGSPVRQFTSSTSLTGALVAGVAVTTLNVKPLPFACVIGDTISVGIGGTADNFTIATTTPGAGATSITVTSHAPTNIHPVGDPVTDSYNPAGWIGYNDVVVRVPVPAGSHQVQGTVQASPAVAQLYFDYVQMEANPAPTGIVMGLWKVPNAGLWITQPQDQDIDTWNTAIEGMIGPGNEFPHVFVNIANLFKNSSTLTTALTLGQTGVTSLAVTALLVAITSGDTVTVGSGGTSQNVIAGASYAVGYTGNITVNSFTSTYAQPIGTPVFDLTTAAQYFWQDGVHLNQLGHSLVTALVWQAVLNSLQTIPQLIGVQSTVQNNYPTSMQTLATGTNIAIGSSGTAGAWVQVVGPVLQVVAEPGDIIEISVNGSWDASATADNGYLDICTFNYPAYTLGDNALVAAVINYVSGVASLGGSYQNQGLNYAAVGAQATNGLASLASVDTITTVYEKIIGRFLYPVQSADIIDGVVNIGMIGKSNTTTQRHILNTSGNIFTWSARNLGPASYNAAT